MIHEWWGFLNGNIKAEADRYAGAGYNVLAVDLFGKVATTPDEAMKLVQGVDQPAREPPNCWRRRIPCGHAGTAMAGWAAWAGVSAGGQSLTLAMNDPRLNAVVLYYGTAGD